MAMLFGGNAVGRRVCEDTIPDITVEGASRTRTWFEPVPCWRAASSTPYVLDHAQRNPNASRPLYAWSVRIQYGGAVTELARCARLSRIDRGKRKCSARYAAHSKRQLPLVDVRRDFILAGSVRL